MNEISFVHRKALVGSILVLAQACGAPDPASTAKEDDSTGATSDGPSLAAAANVPFTCLQTSSGRAQYKQKVTGEITAGGVPVNVQIFRGLTLKLEHQASVGVLVPGYSGGYYETHNHLTAFSLGSETINDYYLLLPDTGPTSSPFTAQLHLYFNHGDAGWWQKSMSCTLP